MQSICFARGKYSLVDDGWKNVMAHTLRLHAVPGRVGSGGFKWVRSAAYLPGGMTLTREVQVMGCGDAYIIRIHTYAARTYLCICIYIYIRLLKRSRS